MGFLRVVALTTAIGCADDGGFMEKPPDAPPAMGTLSVAWTVTDLDGAPIDCDSVGAQTVTLSVRNVASATGIPVVFGCSSGSGRTPLVPVGQYLVDIELTGPSGTLAQLPRRTDLIVMADRDTPIGDVTFAVNALGGLELQLRTVAVASNCEPPAGGGAGITGMTLALQRRDGTCQPASLDIAAGATRPATTYAVSCASPQVAPCIENDQRVIARDVPSGAYTVRIRGKVGATDCWVNDDSLVVPALGQALMRTLNLAKQPGPGC